MTWRRLYGRRNEQDAGAEALRREAKLWHGRFLACGAIFVALLGLAWLLSATID